MKHWQIDLLGEATAWTMVLGFIWNACSSVPPSGLSAQLVEQWGTNPGLQVQVHSKKFSALFPSIHAACTISNEETMLLC